LVSKDHLLAKVAPREVIRLTMRSQVNKKNFIGRCVEKRKRRRNSPTLKRRMNRWSEYDQLVMS
jgi:hypothetical protein